MDGVTKKIVVLKDIHSNVIEEAILVLRGEPDNIVYGSKKAASSKNRRGVKDFLVKEAEAVINNYMEEHGKPATAGNGRIIRKENRDNRYITNFAINTALAGSIILLVFIITKII